RIAGQALMSRAMAKSKRLIVGISGASGIIYGVRVLATLRGGDIETHLVMSRAPDGTPAYEMGMDVAQVPALPDVVRPMQDVGVSIASGSFKTEGMIVAPGSIKSMSEIAAGTTGTLLTRAADVVLKERRRLVLLVRETPLHMGHLRTMASVSEMGAIVMPPVPAFYHKPKTIDDLISQTIGRALDLFGFDFGLVKRWGEEPPEESEERPVRRFRKG